jgi:LAO/AO transport system kinase
VLAVDPSSAGSGGALLGDRIRMGAIGQDPRVFIRSMGARGAHGGIAAGTVVVLELMERFGLGEILVETVGVGQTEIGVDVLVDTVVLVLVPESGDAVQAMKAGLTEIADVFVVNKADRPGAEALASVLRSAVEEARLAAGESDAPEARRWTPPVLLTSADRGAGVDPLLDALERHHRHLLETGELEAHRRARATLRFRQAVDAALRRRVAHAAGVDGWEGRVVDWILEGRTSVDEAVAAFLERFFPPSGPGAGSGSASPGATR